MPRSKQSYSRSLRYKAGANLAVGLAVASLLLIMVNYLSFRHYRLFDWTSGKLYTLSGKTENVLAGLEEPLKIYVFYQPRHRAYPYVMDLLEEYAHASNKIEIQKLDPDRDLARVKMLAKKLKIGALNVIVMEYGDRRRELSDSEMMEIDRSAMRFGAPPRVKSFSGEEAITSAIVDLTEGEQTRLYFTAGHGEGSLKDAGIDGFSELGNKLERENILAAELVLVGQESVPGDCDVLVIGGPTRPFPPEEVNRLDAYMEKGGKLLVLLDPLSETNLISFLKKWGVDTPDTIVVDPARKLPFVDASNLYVQDFTGHEISGSMKNSAVLFILARAVDVAGGRNPDLDAATLLRTSPSGWGEVDFTKTTFSFDESSDRKGPVSLAVAVKEKKEPHARMVVVGDSDFVANGQLRNMGNADFFLNCTNWLAVREKLIAIGPKDMENVKLTFSSAQMLRVFLLCVVILPSLGLVLGIAVWIRRRR
ncbi:MAG: GldG family protein [Candidatus Tritonobacter lacicola]|nr:GldG family protein [Candidatus Tritonobacter lacicola]